MITLIGSLIVGLAIMALQVLALFLMILGAIDIYYHVKEKKI
jgi:uncharacterized Tic20 family protein